MESISANELKSKLEKKDNFKLVFTMSQWHWEAMRIPGSIHVDSFNKAEEVLTDKIEEIIVY